ncbi:hypothetical protein LCGC14_1776610, partial [marine sediment metagenome]
GTNRLTQILKRGYNYCSGLCRKKLSIDEFYTIYRADKTLKKIWPSCKKCMGSQRKYKRSKATRDQIIGCFEHYSRSSPDSLSCYKCGHNKFNSLTLLDLKHKTKESILNSSMYRCLYKHDFPKMRLKLVCYNCAFEYIHKHSKR